MQQQQQAAIRSFQRQLRPEPLLAALSRACDKAFSALLRLHPLPQNAALLAIGGYGRGELYPHSDVDILILLQQAPCASETQQLEHLIAAFWDLGLDLSHSVRQLNECQDLAANDITIETSLLEARHIAGNTALLPQLQKALLDQCQPRAFFQAKRAEMVARHARYHNTAYALEPNCKESPGGLRDLLVPLWIARAAGLGSTWHDLAQAKLITPTEFRSLRRADLAFKRLRIELHLLTKRREDRVLFDLQPALAKRYGFNDQSHQRASERLMQRYYWAARVVSQLNAIAMQLLEAHLFPAPPSTVQRLGKNYRLVQGRLDIRHQNLFERDPSLLFNAFLSMQRHPDARSLSARTLRAMWNSRKLINADFRRNPLNQQLFLEILQEPRLLIESLQTLALLNLLPNYLPEFRRIVGQMQHDLFHAYTVDQHTLLVIRNVHRFTQAEHAHENPLASQLMAELNKPWRLIIAALYHDIAKGRGGDHSELGARDAKRFCQRHGLGEADTNLIVFLVRHHLSLSHYAQKRDLSDPAVINEFAQLFESREQLDALYCLTVADIKGTSNIVWNAWKGKLLATLYHQTADALNTLAQGRHLPSRQTALAKRKADAATQLQQLGISETQRQAFWQAFGVDYFLRHSSNELVWHAHQLAAHPKPTHPVVKSRVIADGSGLQIVVYTPDRSDLFVDLCQYFEQNRYSIQDARIHTSQNGWALDSFVLLPLDNAQSLEQHGHHIEHSLPQALSTASAQKTASKRSTAVLNQRLDAQLRVFPIVPTVELRPGSSPHSWRLAITAGDRPGLLYSLAQVFAEHGTSLQMAKITTLGNRVEDVFLLKAEALTDPKRQLQFERDLLSRLQTPASNSLTAYEPQQNRA